MNNPTGIEGLKGREPIGCAVTIGVKKGGSGYPVEKDWFHIVSRKQDGSGAKPYLPAFASFNSAPAERRKILLGNIVHAHRADCFEHYLKNQVIGKAHPDMRPFCVGDGKTAMRWLGGDPDNFKQIVCPHDRCEYRSAPKGKPVSCKPFMRFLFRLRWNKPGMPEMLAQITSGSWNTAANFKGLFDYMDNTARELGLEQYSLFGLPIVLTLVEQTKPSARSRFPVIEVSTEIDPIDFFRRQREDIRSLSAPVPVAALTHEEEQDPAVIAADMASITVPSS